MSSHAIPVSLKLADRGDGDRVAWITIDRARKANVLDAPTIHALHEIARRAGAEEGVRAVVVTGAGDRTFVGGADVTAMAALAPASAEAFISELHGAMTAIRAIPVPVIARINGYCLGAGLEIAAACDLRVATDHSVFGMPEVKVGIPSVIEAALLPRLVGWGGAARLVLLGENVGAEEALRMGLIDRLVPVSELEAAVEAWIESILAAGSNAVRLQKALMRQWERLPLESAIQAGISAFRASFESDEPRRLMARFMDRRKRQVT